MVNAVYHRFTLGNKARNHQTGRGAQIGCHHRCTRQFFHAFHLRNLTFYLDFCTQPHHLVDVHETVFKNRLRHRAATHRYRIERHELRLHIRRKAGVFSGAERLRLHAATGLHTNKAIACCDDGTCLTQFVDQCVEMIGTAIFQNYIATGGGNSA